MSDTRDQDIIDNVVATITGLESGGSKVFNLVTTIQDPEGFVYSNDPLRTNAAGIVGGRSRRHFGQDVGQLYVARLPVDVVVRVYKQIPPGGDVKEAVDEVNRLVDLVRDILVVDRTRGGKANYIMFEGKLIEGTNIDGEPRPIKHKPNISFFGAVIPVSCGYSING